MKLRTFIRQAILLGTTLLIHVSELGAQRVDTVSVYFDHDEGVVFNSDAIDQLINRLEHREKALIIGYCDYLGTTEYNRELAQKRAQSVATYISRHGQGKLAVSRINARGELPVDSENGQGIPKHRRVDVIVQFVPVNEEPQVDPEPELIQMDTAAGSSAILQGLGFMPGRHYPLPESGPVLESLVTLMKKYPKMRIEIQGFICCEYNLFDGLDQDTQEQKLSHNRAKFVYEYLIESGIDAERLTYRGYGSSRPKVFPELTEEDMQANRRVEIMVIK